MIFFVGENGRNPEKNLVTPVMGGEHLTAYVTRSPNRNAHDSVRYFLYVPKRSVAKADFSGVYISGSI